jgi:hypothetical protein
VGNLIANGHTLTEIRKYTLRQALSFAALINNRRVMDMVSSAISHRLAYHADPKEFTKFLKESSKDSEDT